MQQPIICQVLPDKFGPFLEEGETAFTVTNLPDKSTIMITCNDCEVVDVAHETADGYISTLQLSLIHI